MLKRVLNAELEKKVFEDEMMEKLSVVPAEYEVYEEYASRQEDFDRDFFTYCNTRLLDVHNNVSAKRIHYRNASADNKAEILKMFFNLRTAADLLYRVLLADSGQH